MEIEFVKMTRVILKWIFCNVPTQMYIKKFEEKLLGKVGEGIFDS